MHVFLSTRRWKAKGLHQPQRTPQGCTHPANTEDAPGHHRQIEHMSLDKTFLHTRATNVESAFCDARCGAPRPPRKIPFWWSSWVAALRREIPETVRFNLLAFHAGAQWAPVLFNYRESEMVGESDLQKRHDRRLPEFDQRWRQERGGRFARRDVVEFAHALDVLHVWPRVPIRFRAPAVAPSSIS